MADLAKTVLGLRDADLMEIATALGIDDKHKSITWMTFTEAEWNSNRVIREAVAYIGFDAKKIVEQFFKKAAENPITAADAPTVINGINLYEKNDPKTDLFFLNVFLERGNNLHLPDEDTWFLASSEAGTSTDVTGQCKSIATMTTQNNKTITAFFRWCSTSPTSSSARNITP